MALEIHHFTALSEHVLNSLAELEKTIFEKPLTAQDFFRELSDKKNLMVLVALQEQEPCGYKIGFASSSRTFFSWSGGVSPQHRNAGIAKALMFKQHQIAKEQGYTYVRTHTKNKYREMLILNIKVGFDIVGIYKSLEESHQGIILEKAL